MKSGNTNLLYTLDEVRRHIARAELHKRVFNGESVNPRLRGVLKDCRRNYELFGTGVVRSAGPAFDPLGFTYEKPVSLSKVASGRIRCSIAMIA